MTVPLLSGLASTKVSIVVGLSSYSRASGPPRPKEEGVNPEPELVEQAAMAHQGFQHPMCGSGDRSARPAVFLDPVQPLCHQCDDQLFLLVWERVTGAVDDGEGRPRIVLDEVPCVRIAD
jgi:hypothetical protein